MGNSRPKSRRPSVGRSDVISKLDTFQGWSNNPHRLSIVMLILVLFHVYGCSTHDPSFPINYSCEHNSIRGVTVAIWVPNHSATDEAIIAFVSATNNSTELVLWPDIDGITDVFPSITTSLRKDVEKTSYGKDWISNDAIRHIILKPLKPAQTKIWAIDIKRYYILTSGKYDFHVSPHFNYPNGFKVPVQSHFEIHQLPDN